MWVIVTFLLLLICAFLLYYSYRKTDILRRGRKNTPPCTPIEGKNLSDLPGKKDAVKINIDDFLEQYLIGECLPEDVVMELQLKRLAGDAYATVSKQVLNEANQKCALYWRKETEREACLATEEQAKAKEREGKLDEAIALYEKNVASGYPAFISFDRLISIYQKSGDIDKEIHILEKAVKAFGDAHPILKDMCEIKLEKAKRQKK